jgi:histone H3/H4
MGKSSKTMRHDKAGLRPSVPRVEKAARRGLCEKRTSDRAPVYLAGVLESLTQTLLHQAADNAAQLDTRRVCRDRVDNFADHANFATCNGHCRHQNARKSWPS